MAFLEVMATAIHAYWEERHDEALQRLNHALQLKPKDEHALTMQGGVLNELGHYEEAITSFNHALEIQPDKDEAWFGRGIALTDLGRPEEAVASYDRGLEIDPNFDTVWFNRGFTCLKWSIELAQQEKFDAAREKWNEALVSGGKSNDEDWPEEVTETLLEVAKTGYLGFARQLIVEAGMEERLFPLTRAIDYLQTGDEALVEKLSPEVRGIVEEVVAKLRTTTASE